MFPVASESSVNQREKQIISGVLSRMDIRLESTFGERIDCPYQWAGGPIPTNLVGVRDHPSDTGTGGWKSFGQTEHRVMAGVARHKKHVRKRTCLEFAVDRNRRPGVRVRFSGMGGNLDLQVSVGLTVYAGSRFRFGKGAVLATLAEVDALCSAMLNSEEILDHVNVEVDLAPALSRSWNTGYKKAIGPTNRQFDGRCRNGV